MTSDKQLLPLLVLLGVLLAGAPSGFAQAPPPQPLNFGNNFLVTGDYVVAGAYNMTTKFTTINGVSYAVGTINVPDVNKGVANPGIQGPTSVPKGAQVIAALLYWQTVEKVSATGTATGQNGYFLPIASAGNFPKGFPGYPISGTNVTSPGNPSVSWSSGGCGGSSTGKVVKTYRADVGGGLPVDGNGNSIANTSFQVLLPSSGNSTPLTLGATLVVIYRISAGEGGPSVPLNAIVIYDGDYGQTNAQLTMTQQMHGFYDADGGQVRLTHIVGSGQSNKFENVFLGKDQNTLIKLSSLYKNLPAFPGWYGTWDNPTWTLNGAGNPLAPAGGTPLGSATTQVVPAPSMSGCVSWGAVIMSTTVNNGDNDGILDSWKTDKGYCDYLTNPSCGGPADNGWIPLPGATIGEKDIYLQYDYMCSKVNGPPRDTGDNASDNSCTTGDNTNYSFDPRLAVDSLDHNNAVQKVVDAFKIRSGADGKLFVLHAEPGNAIAESQSTCAATDRDQNNNLTCTFPNEAGTVGFREGLAYIKNQTINTQTGTLGCDPSADPVNCVAVFHHGKKDSYHYTLFSHGVGLPNWFFSDGSIKTVTQSGSTVTFTTASAHNLMPIAGDTVCSGPNSIGRVTVINAITNPNLNGTFCAKPASPPALNKFAITVTALLPSTVLPGYTVGTDPNLAVANGQVTSMSGYSDVGGQNSVISLGYGGWGLPQNLSPPSEGNKWNVKAGTFMHELGHTLGLTHGGTFYNGYSSSQVDPTKNDFTPTFEVNCKPNVQTVMSYVFQFDLLQAPGALNQPPVKVLDYSNADSVATLTESSPQTGGLSSLTYPNTSWFQLSTGPVPSNHCDGTPTGIGDGPYTYTNQPVADFSFSVATGQDINFNGIFPTVKNPTGDVMHPHDEWAGTRAEGDAGLSPGVDLRQVSAAGTVSTIGIGGEAGGFKPAGGGGGFKPAGGGGGLQPAGGGGGFKPAGGGGGFKPAGGGGASAEITHDQANSYPRPAQNLYIQQEEASPRLIDLSWFAPSFGTVDHYNIYQSVAGGPFNPHGSVDGSLTTFQDTVTCNLNGYRYRITAVTFNDQHQSLESSPSNTVPATGEPLLTGCYTVGNFSSPGNAVHGSIVPVTWTLTDDFFITPPAAWKDAVSTNPVNKLAAITKLVAIGPGNTRTPLVTNGVAIQQTLPQGVTSFTVSAGQFTFNWDTDLVPSGSYTFELDLDSGPVQTTTTTIPLQLGIDINDQDTVRIDTLLLPNATVGLAYGPTTLTEDGGTGPFTWTVTGLPSGISQQSPGSPTLSGNTCLAAGTYPVTATVTDSAVPKNSGTQGFTLQVNKANTTTGVGSSLNPSKYQDSVTFTVTVATQNGCGPPMGTVTLLDGGTQIGSNTLSSGSATFTTSILLPGIHNITASYGGDSKFNPSTSNLTPLTQIVKAYTTTSLTSDTNPSAFGQSVTFTATVAPVAPGAGLPTGSVIFLDGATPLGAAAALDMSGKATLTTSTLSVGIHSITASYGGDTLFVGSLSSPLSQQVNAVVTNNGDSGPGSLRQAILDVNAQSSLLPIGIVFSIPGSGVQTITLSSALPALTQPTTLDATTQSGYTGTPVIELNGSSAGASVNGIHISAGGSTVKGLLIDHFGGDGILLDTSGNKIQGNTIQGIGSNADVGVSTVTGNTITGNSISGHGGLGIDLTPAPGVNANQPMGPNNYPVITSATLAGGTTTITGTLNSVPSKTFTIELFDSGSCNASGNGEGLTFLGSVPATTDGSGNAPITLGPVPGLVAGSVITGTSTDASGTTSEFSACVPVTGGP